LKEISKINCIAIDNDPHALNVISEHCRKIESINLAGIFTCALDAVPLINNKSIDVIFLDVEMEEINAAEFIKSLPDPPLIILTAALSKYAISGFEINAVDYLLKPINFECFLKAVIKATTRLSEKNRKLDIKNGHIVKKQGDFYFFVKVDYSTVKVNFNDIKYIEGLKDYIKIYINGKSLITKSTIKHIESKLPSGYYARVHKSYIISIDKIDKIENNQIFIGQQRIPIGMQFRDSFYEKIEKYRL
jgi:two-component system, LytTR family, response regulator